ncbi:metalloprotease [Candidatus Geothermarchaeota archaeon ex4572_27]|nr:MAG: metalloprotease [Candidatus Geothermarchaeota archaeon ex4572_27]
MPLRLAMPREELESLRREATSSTVEVCGLLIGRRRRGLVEVVRVVRARNVEPSPTSFKVPPEDLYRAMVEAEREGLEVVGVYHSHPAPPHPSPTDLEGMARWPVVWLIISSLDGSARAYTLEGGLVSEVELSPL